MAFRAICVALLLSSLAGAGCGTVANLASSGPGAGGVSPFGGVRHDVACIKQAAPGESAVGAHPESNLKHCPRWALRLFCAADLPFSLLGDVVTWPYTMAYSYINQPIPTPPVGQAIPTVIQPVPTPSSPDHAHPNPGPNVGKS